MQELLEYIVKSMVQDPESVSITEQEGEGGFMTYLIHVAPDEVGLIIGKSGRNIQAIRTLARMRSIQTNERVRIEIADEMPAETTPPTE